MRAEPIVNGLRSEWAGSVDVLQVNVLDSANLDLIDRLGARFTLSVPAAEEMRNAPREGRPADGPDFK